MGGLVRFFTTTYLYEPVECTGQFVDLFLCNCDGLGRDAKQTSRYWTVTGNPFVFHLLVAFTKHHAAKNLTEVIVRATKKRRKNKNPIFLRLCDMQPKIYVF
jgi:hypothetical protein